MPDTLPLQLAPERLQVAAECITNYGVGNPHDGWPNNLIACDAVAYNDGRMARAWTPPHAQTVNTAERALCLSLATEACALMGGADVGMGSESDDPFQAFYVVHADPQATAIDAALIRRCFGDSLFPPATITAEPLADNTQWWQAVCLDGEESDPSYFTPWQTMRRWFQQQTAFKATAFVCIGDAAHLYALPKSAYPRGTVITGCAMPRLAIGLTHQGSIAGLFGFSVQT